MPADVVPFCGTIQVKTTGECQMLMFWTELACALGIISVAAVMQARRHETRDRFLVANRKVGVILGMLAITATWTQAPAILASGLYAYRGIDTFLTFWVPNVIALLIPIYLVTSMRRVCPSGYTGPQYLDAVYGPGVRTMGFIAQLISLIGVVALTLVGISQWLSPVLDLPQHVLALTFGAFAFLWVLPAGLPGALVGDRAKVFIVVVLSGGAVALWWFANGAAHPAAAHALPHEMGATVWNTGVVLTVSLIGAIVCNPDVGERNFALVPDPKVQRRAYLASAALFALVTLAFGSLGILARGALGSGVQGFPAFALLKESVSATVIVQVSIGLSIILTAALASYIASAGDLVAVEVYQRCYRYVKGADPSDRNVVRTARIAMPIIVAIALALTLTPDISITKLLESLAAVRGEVIFPMMTAPLLVRLGVPTAQYDKTLCAGMAVGLIGGIALTYGRDLFPSSTSVLVLEGKPLGALFALAAPFVFFAVRLFARPVCRRMATAEGL